MALWKILQVRLSMTSAGASASRAEMMVNLSSRGRARRGLLVGVDGLVGVDILSLGDWVRCYYVGL